LAIPNVVIRWCRKKAKCAYCEQDIEVGQPMVVVIFWNKGEEGNRKWNVHLYFHLERENGQHCWVEQGKDFLKKNPFIPHARGRKSVLSAEDRRKRFLLVRRFNALYQRKQNILAGYPDRLLIEQGLNEQMVGITLDMINLGGVPKSWAEKMM